MTQILTIESIKAINRLFALLSSSNGKHTMILNWSKVRNSHVILITIILTSVSSVMSITCESNRGHNSVSNLSSKPLSSSLWDIVVRAQCIEKKMIIVFKNVLCIQERALFKSVPGKNLMFSFRCFCVHF